MMIDSNFLIGLWFARHGYSEFSCRHSLNARLRSIVDLFVCFWTIHRCKCILLHNRMHLTIPHFTISNWCWKLPFKQLVKLRNKIHSFIIRTTKEIQHFFWINFWTLSSNFIALLWPWKTSSNNSSNNKINKHLRIHIGASIGMRNH